MNNTHRIDHILTAVLGGAILLQACGGRPAASNSDHIRGTLESLNGSVLTVDTTTGSVRVQLDGATMITAVIQSDRAHITDGSFLGITSVPGPDGSERAVEIHVFPESMRGAGEGRREWDLPGAGRSSKMTNGTATASKMTNGTVATSKMTNGTVSAQARGSSLTLVQGRWVKRFADLHDSTRRPCRGARACTRRRSEAWRARLRPRTPER